MPRVIHFEIPVADPERAASFYKAVFGWEINNWGGPVEYWLITTGGEDEAGINGAIIRRTGEPAGESPTAYVCTIGVPSFEEYAGKVAANGGSVITPKMAIPNVGWFAYCKDTEGNQFGIMEEDSKAH